MNNTVKSLVIAIASMSSVVFAQSNISKDIVAGANKEGKLVVYSVTSSAPLLVKGFQDRYPGIKLEYVSLDTTPLYERVVSESAVGYTADVTWSSAMDLQMKLVADGYAMSYASPEASNLPNWAVWQDKAYGTTTEPIGFVYNKNLVDASEVPQTRAEFAKLIAKDKFKNKVTSFDPQLTGVGYLLMTQDMSTSPQTFWNVAKAMNTAGLYPGPGTGAQFLRLQSGDSAIGFNLLASYAAGRIKKDLPNLAYVLPKDYTLGVSRIMFISRKAANPNAAKLWVDFVLSKDGQELLAKNDFGSVRADVKGDMTLSDLTKRIGSAFKPIPVNPSIATPLEPKNKAAFLKEWIASGGAANPVASK